MQTKNKLFTLLVLSAGAAASLAAINKGVKIAATSRNRLDESDGLCYKWRLGDVFYTRSGSGKPLLLIHNLQAGSGSHEWSALLPLLKETHTVYTIDLLGCGRSEKYNMTYTNYLYVQLISDFVKSVIGHRADVIAVGESASIPIMACASNPELFDQIMLINPLSLIDFSRIPGQTARLYKGLIELPIAGTLIYHIAVGRQMIADELKRNGFYNPYSVKASLIDVCYEAAHLGNYPKAVYASVKCNYTKCNIVNALKKINHSLYLVGGKAIDGIEERLEEYKEYNPSIETLFIPETKELPHLEKPSALCDLVNTYFN